MINNRVTKRALLPVIAVTLMALLLVLLFLLQQLRVQERLVADLQQGVLDMAYQATISATQREINTRFQLQVMQPGVIDLVSRAVDATEADLPRLRGELYRMLLPVYRELVAAGLQQFQFHLPDDRVLLRFHGPDRAGDPLFHIRPTVRIANQQQKVAHGFEMGRTTSGYRYVFPLHDGERHIGSVEISMPFGRLQQNLRQLIGSGEFFLIVDREQVLASIDPVFLANYSESAINSQFLVENPQLSSADLLQQSSGRFEAVAAYLRQNGMVRAKMAAHESFIIPVMMSDQQYLASFLSINDLLGRPVAYLVRYSQSSLLESLKNGIIGVGIVAMILILAMAILVLRLQIQRLQLHQDVVRRQQAEQTLRLYANIFKHSGEAIIVTNRDNCIIAVNPAFTQLTGYTLEDVEGKNPRILSSGRTPPEIYQELWRDLMEDGFWQGELWDRRKEGAIYPKWAAISVIRDDEGAISHFIASFTNITERKAAEERIERLAHHDTLTGLLNRYSLESRLDQCLLTCQRERHQLAVIFIDMDRFKVINDTLGHHTGDLLLIEVAHRLRAAVRESDIVARQGGDEFVVVLTRLQNVNDVAFLANKLLNSLVQGYEIEGHKLHSSPSIGVAIYPEDGETVEILLKNADTAMYHAKEKGRNNVQYFTATMTEAARERLRIEQDLHLAIELQQFQLYYQPQICAVDGRFCGVEALLRWHHPQQGMVSPMRFIPIAEESGLIETIGAWVIEEACRQLAHWRQQGLRGIKMAVNISAHQLRSPSLVTLVARILQRHQIHPGDLELEITESVAMENPEHAIDQLAALRSLGVELAIDDFGTGYSSLAYLKRLPISTLKLDRSFVRDIDCDPNDATISSATVALAHALGLKVVAEGVETESQADFLGRIHHCDILQGYLFGRPQPADDLYQLYRQRYAMADVSAK
jgi:diguanylate cyclase (GGDEF)-like protein/PAS domain S-box-containing protein